MAPNGYDWVFLRPGGQWLYTDAEDLPIESRMKEPLFVKMLSYNEGSYNVSLAADTHYCTYASSDYFHWNSGLFFSLYPNV